MINIITLDGTSAHPADSAVLPHSWLIDICPLHNLLFFVALFFLHKLVEASNDLSKYPTKRLNSARFYCAEPNKLLLL